MYLLLSLEHCIFTSNLHAHKALLCMHSSLTLSHGYMWQTYQNPCNQPAPLSSLLVSWWWWGVRGVMTWCLHLCTRHHSKVCSTSLCASCVHVNGMYEVVPEAVLYTAPTVQISLCAVCACSSMWTCSQPGPLSACG